VVAAPDGSLKDLPGVAPARRSGRDLLPVEPAELVPLPEGASLYALPGRTAVGFTGAGLESLAGHGAAAAFLPPGWSVFGLAAYRSEDGAPLLPLFSYAALCWWKGRFHVPAARVERDVKHDPGQFSDGELRRRVARLRKRWPANRLLDHLSRNCALEWGCANAKNLFHERWECPVPLAPACNAACVGCISAQPDAPIPSPQDRLAFVPEVDEVLEFALPHLMEAPRAMVSFGQGCEGEPLLQAERIEAICRAVRARTRRGTLHLNTNGSRPDAVARLFAAGLDSIRVSLNSAQPHAYAAYYRPLTYGFEAVARSIEAAKRAGGLASINYLAFPGFTDSHAEVAALQALIERTGIDLIQWRNLNIDPDAYCEVIGLKAGTPALGMRRLLDHLRTRYPRVRHGYVNPPRETYSRWRVTGEGRGDELSGRARGGAPALPRRGAVAGRRGEGSSTADLGRRARRR
jgi:pyruvate-formate lyase-activating enzyme